MIPVGILIISLERILSSFLAPEPLKAYFAYYKNFPSDSKSNFSKDIFFEINNLYE